MSLKHFVTAVAVAICLLGVGRAQESQKPSKETGILLEVTYEAGRAPAYQTVTWASSPRAWVWYGRFATVPGWQLPAGALPVRAVRIVPFLDEEAVRLTVSVLRGEKFHDAEDTVGSYSARENETITIQELKDFGVEPFQIKVVRAAPLAPAPPAIVNHTKSLEVVGIEPVVSTLPTYKVTLRSLSDKNISAMQVNVQEGAKRLLTGMPQGKEGQALIKAGAVFELKQHLATRAQATAAGFAPESSNAQQIVITTLVFEDGSYEGDAQAAASFRGFAAGRKIEVARVLPVLEKTLATDGSVESLQAALNALSYDSNPAELAAQVKAFPGIKREALQSSIDVSIHGVRRDLLAELERFEQSGIRKENFKSWLTRTRDRYSQWLARISPQDLNQP